MLIECPECGGDQAYDEVHGDEVYATHPCGLCKGYGDISVSETLVCYVESELEALDYRPDYYHFPFRDAATLLLRLDALRDYGPIPEYLRIEILEAMQKLGDFIARTANDRIHRVNGES